MSHEPPTTNYDKWRHFLKDCPSPESFIDWGFYFMIAASLQRRVWMGSKIEPLFSNIYAIPVGKAGVGKGRVIKPVAEILKYHKLDRRQMPAMPADKTAISTVLQAASAGGKVSTTDEAKALQEMVEELRKQEAELAAGGAYLEAAQQSKEEKLLIPIGPDDTTYEALCDRIAKSIRSIPYEEWCEPLKRKVIGNYLHSSMALVLEEISSLFRNNKNANSIVNFLLKTYDCGDHEYETKGSGISHIKKCCMNFFGGTTPEFLMEIFNTSLLNQGFASRTFFLFAGHNRQYKLGGIEYDESQVKGRMDIIRHVKYLTQLYGQVNFTEEAYAFLKHWWEVDQAINHNWRPNKSPALDSYYGRKDIHVKKLACILYFSEIDTNVPPKQCKMEIGLPYIMKALAICEKVEKVMHYALNFGGRNPLSMPTKKVLNHINALNGEGITFNDLLLEHWDDCNNMELMDILRHLDLVEKIKVDSSNAKQIKYHGLVAKGEVKK